MLDPIAVPFADGVLRMRRATSASNVTGMRFRVGVPLWCIVLALAVAVALGAPASAQALRRGPPGAAFYTPPARLVAGPHGSIVWARPLTSSAVLRDARTNVLVLYRSVSPAGKPIVVSGIVALPRGKPPPGGWPVIAWDHGATGVADRCALSKGFWAGEEGRAVVANGFLRRGFAIVESDYAGLGTPGVHPYLIGVSEGRSVIDGVLAARALDRRVGRRWLPIGVSQGGHVSLWAAALAPSWGRALRLTGVVALAPSSHSADQFRLARYVTTPLPAPVAFAALVLAGAQTVGWDPTPVLSARALALNPQVYQRCWPALSAPDSLGGVPPADLLRPNANLDPLYRILDANEPGTLTIRAPVFLGQGTRDTLVPAASTAEVANQLRRHHASVTYRTYPVEHGAPEVLAARHDFTAFITARFHATH